MRSEGIHFSNSQSNLYNDRNNPPDTHRLLWIIPRRPPHASFAVGSQLDLRTSVAKSGDKVSLPLFFARISAPCQSPTSVRPQSKCPQESAGGGYRHRRAPTQIRYKDQGSSSRHFPFAATTLSYGLSVYEGYSIQTRHRFLHAA